MKKLGIGPNRTSRKSMRELSPSFSTIPIVFILLAPVVVGLLHLVESIFERREEHRQKIRERLYYIGPIYAFRKKVRYSSHLKEESKMIKSTRELGIYLRPIVQALKTQVEENKQRAVED